MTRWDADLALALDIADAADALSSQRFGAADLRVESKPDLTPVTDADRAVEQLIRERLERDRPADAVAGEEFGASGDASRRWVLDPIDGTKNFVRGVPVWATLIALQVDGVTTVGVASAPALARRWWACTDGGAWTSAPGVDRRRCHVSAVSRLADAFVSYASLEAWRTIDRYDELLALLGGAWRTRAYGDFWSHLLVAEGAVDVAVEPSLALWDIAALQVVVTEAGGRASEVSGVPYTDGGSAVSSNGLLHDEVIEALRGRELTPR